MLSGTNFTGRRAVPDIRAAACGVTCEPSRVAVSPGRTFRRTFPWANVLVVARNVRQTNRPTLQIIRFPIQTIHETTRQTTQGTPMQPDDAPFAIIETDSTVPDHVSTVATRSRRRSNGATAESKGVERDFKLTDLLKALQAVQNGDFSARLPGNYVGIAGKIADTFNEVVTANQRMARQLKHVDQVVGREGKARQRVRFSLSGGAWAEMETSVNTLIDDLLWPTTGVTRAATAAARGDLLQTVPLDVDGRPLQGEFLRLATIVNTMIKQLGIFTSEVTRVAREVGTDGKLGGQAQVREVTGVWKDLTESVNSMASNLTAQVRNLADVTIAVANGDLSKKITVDVRGEILQLKEAINTMVDQLRSFASEVTRVAREVGTE